MSRPCACLHARQLLISSQSQWRVVLRDVFLCMCARAHVCMCWLVRLVWSRADGFVHFRLWSRYTIAHVGPSGEPSTQELLKEFCFEVEAHGIAGLSRVSQKCLCVCLCLCLCLCLVIFAFFLFFALIMTVFCPFLMSPSPSTTREHHHLSLDLVNDLPLYYASLKHTFIQCPVGVGPYPLTEKSIFHRETLGTAMLVLDDRHHQGQDRHGHVLSCQGGV